MSAQYTGQVAIVAGGTGGLGRAVSQAFLDAGATVIVTYRTQAEYEDLVRAAGAKAARLGGGRLDVTDEAAARVFIDGVVAQHQRVDALVNAVGGYAGDVKLWEAEAQVLERMLAMNLRSGYALSRAIVPAMLAQKHGSIVNIAAKAGLDHPAGAAAYAASKAAALAMMNALAAELSGTGVRVNSVLPSIIDTEANRKAMPKADFARWPKPAQIARVILFLCSADAKLIHGAAIPVYGD